MSRTVSDAVGYLAFLALMAVLGMAIGYASGGC